MLQSELVRQVYVDQLEELNKKIQSTTSLDSLGNTNIPTINNASTTDVVYDGFNEDDRITILDNSRELVKMRQSINSLINKVTSLDTSAKLINNDKSASKVKSTTNVPRTTSKIDDSSIQLQEYVSKTKSQKIQKRKSIFDFLLSLLYPFLSFLKNIFSLSWMKY